MVADVAKLSVGREGYYTRELATDHEQYLSGQGVLAVGFDHRTSREGDPLLHTHLVIANRVQGPDGRWTALDGRDLYRHRLAADAPHPVIGFSEVTLPEQTVADYADTLA